MAAQPPRQAESMRDRLLRAGREALIEDGLQIIRRGLTIPMIVQRVPTSPTTFDNHFGGNSAAGFEGGKDKFVEELLSSLVTDSPRATQALLVEELSSKLVESNGDPRQAIRELCRWDFEQVRSDPATLIRLFVTALGRNHKTTINAVRAEYKQITEYGVQAYEQILARWGATLRKPFTSESIAVLFTGIVEGLALRWLLDPDTVPAGLFGDAVVAFAAAVVDVEQRQEHIDDVIAPLANEVMREFQLSRRDESIDNPRQVIIEAAKSEFAQRGFFATELTHIATTSGVELRTLKRLFPHKVDLVVGGLRPAFEQLKASVADDIDLKRPAEDVLRRYADRLTALFMDDRAMSDALLAIITHDIVHSPETVTHIKEALDFPSLIAPTIGMGQQAGVFSPSMAASEIAAMLVNSLLFRCFTRRSCTAQEVAAEVGSVFLNGILATK